MTGTFLGDAYEYLCSVFTEIFFGKVFWDYSKLPFNLGGIIQKQSLHINGFRKSDRRLPVVHHDHWYSVWKTVL